MPITHTSSWLSTKDPDKIEEALEKYRAGTDAITEAAKNYSGGDERYGLWLLLCAHRCARAVGVTIFDIADYTWADAYESGSSPKAAVREALQADDTFSAMFGGE